MWPLSPWLEKIELLVLYYEKIFICLGVSEFYIDEYKKDDGITL